MHSASLTNGQQLSILVEGEAYDIRLLGHSPAKIAKFGDRSASPGSLILWSCTIRQCYERNPIVSFKGIYDSLV